MRLSLVLIVALAMAGCAAPDPRIQVEAPARILPQVALTFIAIPNGQNAGDPAWEFGDGARAEGSPVNHAYETAGSFLVRMTWGEHTRSIVVGVSSHHEFSEDVRPRSTTALSPPAEREVPIASNLTRFHVYADFPQMALGALRAQVFSQSGDLIMSVERSAPPLELTLEGPLAPGTYTVVFSSSAPTQTVRINAALTANYLSEV